MVFSSVTFLFFFMPIVILVYFAARKELRNIALLFSSILFYVWGEGWFVLVLLANVAVNYLSAILINGIKSKNIRRFLLVFTVIFNLWILFYYKYSDFAINIFNGFARIFHKQEIPLLNVALPIGLSFFTFQGLSYVIDVYRKDVPVQKDPLKVALYISMFPQLVAGPIVRYSDICKDLDYRTTDVDKIYSGSQRFIAGLGKKVILADVLAATSDKIFALPVDQLTPSIAWLGAISYTLQIYFDFSGYSDMAIGLGRIFGFEFCENFNLPYISTSISEFWRRWHISLSSWFRDYLYIPLGGNRKGNVYFNLFIVFFCTGLWHGASYYFIVWGLWHGFFVVTERVLRKRGIEIHGIIGWIYTMMVVVVGWVFFHERGFKFISAMFGIYSKSFKWYGFAYYVDARLIFTIITGIIISSGVIHKLKTLIEESISNRNIVTVMRNVVLVCILFCCIFMIASGNYSPFIYFRF